MSACGWRTEDASLVSCHHAGCTHSRRDKNAGESLGLPVLPTGSIGVGVFLDRDGSASQTTGDTVYGGVRVALLVAAGTDTIRTAVSDVNGLAVFDSVPIGSYRIVVDRRALADSIGVVAGDTGTIRIDAGQGNAAARVVRLGFREVTIAEARLLAPGARVYVRGVVLAGFQAFRDSSSFIANGGAYIRITGARHRPGRTGNNAGDSVLVLATTGARDGQPVLVDGLIGSLAQLAAPIAIPVTVAEARDAKGGTLDAALVTIIGARITDTAAAGTDFRVRIEDAADPSVIAEVVVDAQLGAPRTIFRPGFPITIRGVMVPRGDGTWVLKPRGASDITIG